MLRHIIDAAQRMGMTRLSLETGSRAYFDPARALYRKHGFVECAPFGEYKEDPNSVFMTLELDRAPLSASSMMRQVASFSANTGLDRRRLLLLAIMSFLT
jgi:putative acetyltransferase